jgi:protein SCO1/2
MLQFFSKYKLFVIVLTMMSVVIISIIYSVLTPIEVLPIYQPSQVSAALVAQDIRHQKKYHIISDFSLTNQEGQTITQDTYDGKIYVTDFFFTTCQTICPVMTSNMLELQDKLQDNPKVLLLSHTVMPEIDSVSQLKKYATQKKGKPHKMESSYR